MTARVSARRLIATAALSIGLVGFMAACGSNKEEAPTTTPTTTTTTTVSPTPTEKGIDPTGGNKFTPSVKAPTPATAIPGDN